MGAASAQGGTGQGAGQGGAAKAPAYKTPRWVQVWFLRRSRDNWKKKYMALKAESKRLQNRVNDVTKSRQRWRALAEGVEGVEGVEGIEGSAGAAESPGGQGRKRSGAAAPPEPGAALKKGGPGDPGAAGPGEARRGRPRR
jgi:hypothetical protein